MLGVVVVKMGSVTVVLPSMVGNGGVSFSPSARMPKMLNHIIAARPLPLSIRLFVILNRNVRYAVVVLDDARLYVLLAEYVSPRTFVSKRAH